MIVKYSWKETILFVFKNILFNSSTAVFISSLKIGSTFLILQIVQFMQWHMQTLGSQWINGQWRIHQGSQIHGFGCLAFQTGTTRIFFLNFKHWQHMASTASYPPPTSSHLFCNKPQYHDHVSTTGGIVVPSIMFLEFRHAVCAYQVSWLLF